MFYQLMSAKYANRRTFAPETEGAGAAAEAAEALETAGNGGDADADANAGAQGKPDAGQAGDAAKSEADASVIETPKTDDEKAALLREVMEKKDALKAARNELKKFEGIDLDRYKALVAKEAAAEQEAAEAAGDFERVKAMMAEAHQSEKADLEAKVIELTEKLGSKDGVIGELTIGNAFGNSTFISQEMVLSPAKTRVLYGSHFEVEDGKVVAYDKPRGAADRTKLVDGSGSLLSFNDALAKIVNADPDKKSVLRANLKPGAGSSTTTATKTTEQKGDNLYGRSRLLGALNDMK